MDTESDRSSRSEVLRGVLFGGVRGRGDRRGRRVSRRGGRGSHAVGDSESNESSRSDVQHVAGRGVTGIGGRKGKRGGRRGRRGSHAERGRGAATTVRAAETEDERKVRVKGLVASLTNDRAKAVLCLAIERQLGLILDILDRIEPAQAAGFHPSPGGASPSWCSCNRCRDMPTVAERDCCGYTPDYCLSQLPDIQQYILDEGVLALARLYRREILVFPDEKDLCKANRHAAYRQFILWRHGKLGQGMRMVIPSCCVWTIRDCFSGPYGQYIGFKPSRLC